MIDALKARSLVYGNVFVMPSKLCTFEMDLLSICKIYKDTNKSFISTFFFVYVVLFIFV